MRRRPLLIRPRPALPKPPRLTSLQYAPRIGLANPQAPTTEIELYAGVDPSEVEAMGPGALLVLALPAWHGWLFNSVASHAEGRPVAPVSLRGPPLVHSLPPHIGEPAGCSPACPLAVVPRGLPLPCALPRPRAHTPPSLPLARGSHAVPPVMRHQLAVPGAQGGAAGAGGGAGVHAPQGAPPRPAAPGGAGARHAGPGQMPGRQGA